MKSIKHINTENFSYYFFNDIINIKKIPFKFVKHTQ